MRLDHSVEVLDFDGSPVMNGAKALTFKQLVLTALNTPGPNENQTADAKARCFELSFKVHLGKTIDLDHEEAAFIKERGGVALTAFAYGRLCHWLEGKEQQVVASAEEAPGAKGDEPAQPSP